MTLHTVKKCGEVEVLFHRLLSLHWMEVGVKLHGAAASCCSNFNPG